MPLPPKPILTPAPDAPVRGEDQTTFANKANDFVAWQANDLRPDLQDALDWTDGAFNSTVAVYDDTVVERQAAEQAVVDAQAERTGAEVARSGSEAARDLALSYRDTAEIYKDGAESAAAAAQSAAGLPAIEGKANFVLRVRPDGLAVEWGGAQNVSDTIVTARTLTPPEYLPCDGSSYLASSYPALSDFFDLSPFFDFNAVTSGFGTTSIRDIATDGSGIWVAVGSSGVMTRSADNGATWSSVTSGFGTTVIRGIATDGTGVWVAGGDSGVMTRSTDSGAPAFSTPDTPIAAPLNRYIYTGVSA